MGEHILDARRLLCPMPVIKTQKEIKTLKAGDELRVLATDPGTVHDIPAWCRMYGHEVLSIVESEQEVHIRIKVGALDD